MSYDLKCEMIAKKLLSLNYPPHFCDFYTCFLWLDFLLMRLLDLWFLFYCKSFFESILRCICLEYCGIFIFFAYNE